MYISVTVMATGSAVTVVKTDIAVTAVAADSADSDVYISVTALSVATTHITSLSH